MSPEPSNKQAKVVPKKQVQIIFTDYSNESLRIVLETEESLELVRLIQDYMKNPDEVGWDAHTPRPKSLSELKTSLPPLEIEAKE